MNIVEESRSYTYMSKEELLKEADKLIANEDKFVKKCCFFNYYK